MGRGLSAQQLEILAAAVAVNAARNGGEPSPVEVLVDLKAGVVENTMFGPRPRRRRRVMTASIPDMTEGFVLVALAGFRRPVVSGYSDYRKWIDGEHKRRVSLCRAMVSLESRQLIAYTPHPGDFRGAWNREDDRSKWTAEQLLAGETNDNLAGTVEEFWGRWRRYQTRGYTLTPEAFAAVGDRWKSADGTAMVAMFDHAEGLEYARQKRARRQAYERNTGGTTHTTATSAVAT